MTVSMDECILALSIVDEYKERNDTITVNILKNELIRRSKKTIKEWSIIEVIAYIKSERPNTKFIIN